MAPGYAKLDNSSDEWIGALSSTYAKKGTTSVGTIGVPSSQTVLPTPSTEEAGSLSQHSDNDEEENPFSDPPTNSSDDEKDYSDPESSTKRPKTNALTERRTSNNRVKLLIARYPIADGTALAIFTRPSEAETGDKSFFESLVWQDLEAYLEEGCSRMERDSWAQLSSDIKQRWGSYVSVTANFPSSSTDKRPSPPPPGWLSEDDMRCLSDYHFGSPFNDPLTNVRILGGFEKSTSDGDRPTEAPTSPSNQVSDGIRSKVRKFLHEIGDGMVVAGEEGVYGTSSYSNLV